MLKHELTTVKNNYKTMKTTLDKHEVEQVDFSELVVGKTYYSECGIGKIDYYKPFPLTEELYHKLNPHADTGIAFMIDYIKKAKL